MTHQKRERELFRRARGGDARAIDDLARSLRPFVAAVCRHRGIPDQDLPDLVQETLARCVARLHRLENDDNPAAWVARIAANLCADYWAERGRRRLDSLDEFADSAAASTSREDDPAETVIRSEQLGHVRACMANLTPEHRTLLDLRYLCGHSWPQLCEHWPEDPAPKFLEKRATFFAHLKGAREALATCLQARGVFPVGKPGLWDAQQGRPEAEG